MVDLVYGTGDRLYDICKVGGICTKLNSDIRLYVVLYNSGNMEGLGEISTPHKNYSPFWLLCKEDRHC